MISSPLLNASVMVAVLLPLITGCGKIRATLPSMERTVKIAKESAMERGTWIPLTAAAVIGVTGADDNISDWASDHTPVFGSQSRASGISDDLRDALVAGMVLSSIFTPTPAGDSAFPTHRVVTNALAFGTVAGIVETGKRTFKRERPNERDTRSFPSGHSSGAFSSAILLEQNLNAMVKQPLLRKSIKVGAIGSAAAVAWARVEAQEHFPVDVLASAALSNFVVKVFYKLRATEGSSAAPPIAVEASRQGFMLRLDQSF